MSTRWARVALILLGAGSSMVRTGHPIFHAAKRAIQWRVVRPMAPKDRSPPSNNAWYRTGPRAQPTDKECTDRGPCLPSDQRRTCLRRLRVVRRGCFPRWGLVFGGDQRQCECRRSTQLVGEEGDTAQHRGKLAVRVLLRAGLICDLIMFTSSSPRTMKASRRPC
jgi:hypothetical protein